ncbi:hypothetical protein SLS62_007990 [Diatrype stigma]|uniref:BTB domain-containing protein n=1 Tax=Diatrype stigma TaxID=117547 RepID=A0AAN9YPV3_9PEZI
MADNTDIVFHEVPDMSIDDDVRGKIITVIVGSERRRFQVHLQSLGPVLAKLVDESTQTVELPDDDPQAFNLFVSWRYNRDLPLPRVPDLSRYMPKPQPAPKTLFQVAANGGAAAQAQAQAQASAQAETQAHPQAPTQAQAAQPSGNDEPADLLFKRYTPYRETESSLSYNHICFQHPMSKYSPEELRLQFQQSRLSADTTKVAPAMEAPNTFCNGPLNPIPLPPATAPSLAPASTTVPFGLPVAAQPTKAAGVQLTKVVAQPSNAEAAQISKAETAQPSKATVQPTTAADQPKMAAAQPTKVAAAPQQEQAKPYFPNVTTYLGKRQKPGSNDAKKGTTRRLPGAFPSSRDTSASGSMFNVGAWFPLASTSKASGSGDSAPTTASEHEHDDGGSDNDSEAGASKPETLQSLMAAADADAKPAEGEEHVPKGDGKKEEDEKAQDDKGKGKEQDNIVEGDEGTKEGPAAADSKTDTDAGKGKGKATTKGKDAEDLKDQAIPPWIPAPVARQAAALQDTLLALALLADKYKLWGVFNAALDAYRAGERQLARPFPPLRHVLLCHRHAHLPCWEQRRPEPPLDPFPYPFFEPLASRFMYDHAYALAVRHKLMRRYAALFARDPRFAAEMLTRLDGARAVPGFQERGGARVPGGKGPLDETVLAYRYPIPRN